MASHVDRGTAEGRELQFAASLLSTLTAIRAHVIDSGAHVHLRPAGTKRARAVGCN